MDTAAFASFQSGKSSQKQRARDTVLLKAGNQTVVEPMLQAYLAAVIQMLWSPFALMFAPACPAMRACSIFASHSIRLLYLKHQVSH